MKKFALILCCCSLGLLKAQHVEVGVIGGMSLYSGDLSPTEFGIYFETVNPSAGLFTRINTGKVFSGRLNFNYGKISGNDANGRNVNRGLSFRSEILELSLTGEFNLFRIGYEDGFQVMPFLFAGVGVYHFNPEALYEGNYIELQPLGTEGQGLQGYNAPYQLTQFCLPVGGGLKFVFNQKFTIGVEVGGRKLFTDYLDDVSAMEINYTELYQGNGEIAARMSNPNVKNPEEAQDLVYIRGSAYDDWYYLTSITLSYHFGNGGGGYSSLPRSRGRKGQLGCPTF